MPRSIEAPVPRTETTPSAISRSASSASSASAAMRSAFSFARSAARWIAEPLITAAREAKVPTAYGILRVSPVVISTSSNRTPRVSATICAKAVWWPWPWVVSPVATLTRPEVSMCTCAPS